LLKPTKAKPIPILLLDDPTGAYLTGRIWREMLEVCAHIVRFRHMTFPQSASQMPTCLGTVTLRHRLPMKHSIMLLGVKTFTSPNLFAHLVSAEPHANVLLFQRQSSCQRSRVRV
jgi:hypothetical protein